MSPYSDVRSLLPRAEFFNSEGNLIHRGGVSLSNGFQVSIKPVERWFSSLDERLVLNYQSSGAHVLSVPPIAQKTHWTSQFCRVTSVCYRQSSRYAGRRSSTSLLSKPVFHSSLQMWLNVPRYLQSQQQSEVVGLILWKLGARNS